MAKHERAGFEISDLGIEASIPKVKPRLRRRAPASPQPVASAVKGQRRIHFDGHWQEATIYDMDALVPGNEVVGPAVIEAATTTCFLPIGRKLRMDELAVMWLE